MPLHAAEFFDELGLPFRDSTVVGNTYYAAPVPDSPLRLRIDFSRTVYADTYGGLRVAIVHPHGGETDAVELSFLDHGTFRRRDEANNTLADSDWYGAFYGKYYRGRTPWEGADTTGLRAGIQQYTAVWFPGAWTVPESGPAMGRAASRTPDLTRRGARAR
ncbi:hypothetical protein ACWEL8_09455 [Streptomyces sp. NPDC004690]